jgi:hypothetical protein
MEGRALESKMLWRLVIKTSLSLFFGGLFYALWLGVFLLTFRWGCTIVDEVVRLAAPLLTALGFAVGSTLYERLTGVRGGGFTRLFIWPLSGCSLGAVVVYPIGPMLIVFSMLTVGTVAVLIRDILDYLRGSSGRSSR